MLKAWEKVRDGADVITNFRAWLTRLTYNLCIDMHRERNRGAHRIESLEAIAEREEEGLVSVYDTPGSAALRCELETIIHRAIENLPKRLCSPGVLHFIREKSYQDIAQQLAISYDNVRKRISQARAILRKQLNGYLRGVDNATFDLSQTLLLAPPLPNAGKSAEATVQESILGEVLVSSGELQEVGIVAALEPEDAALSVVQSVPAIVAAQSDEETGTGEMSVLRVWGSLDDRERGMGKFLLLSYSPSSLQSEIPSRESIGDEDEDSFLLSQSSSNQPEECVTQVYRRGIWSAIGKQDLLHSLVQEMRLPLALRFARSLFEGRWRVWADSGGC
jgi:RNA polymerase sigma factor (sigma-70 family)